MKRLFFSLAVLLLAVFTLNYTTVEAKTLEVQAISQSNGVLPKNGVRIPLVRINVRASDEDVTIESMTFTRSGLSSNEDIDRVWLQRDYSRLTRSRSFSNDDELTLEFTKDFVVKAGTTEQFYLLANLSVEGSGRSIQINLAGVEADADVIDPVYRARTTTNQTKNTARTPGVFTHSRARYDRSEYRIECRNSKCSLVKR